MSRTTAIRITNEEARAAEYRKDARRDAFTAEDRSPTVVDVIRAAREIMCGEELLRLCKDAARLNIRAPMFDAEDRADCAAELVWQSLAENNGCPPRRASRRASLLFFCGQAKNWRARKLTSRAADKRDADAEEDRRAMSEAPALDMVPDTSAAYLAAAARQNAESAHRAAAEIIARLHLNPGGPVYAVLYQWARNRTAEVCAEENGVKLSAWKMRTKRGGDLLREAFPDSADLLAVLTDGAPILTGGQLVYSTEDASRAAGSSSKGWVITRERDQRAREGTNNGDRPVRAETAQEARELCRMRHQCPTPGLTDIGQARIRRGYMTPAPSIPASVTERGEKRPRGFLWVEGRTMLQTMADARRTLAQDAARNSRREASIDRAEITRMG